VLEACDEAVAIPMPPTVDSLNVGAAAAVFLYEVNRQRKKPEPPRRQDAESKERKFVWTKPPFGSRLARSQTITSKFMNQKQLANVLIKILGLSSCVQGVMHIASGIFSALEQRKRGQLFPLG
jgi:tRNA C32,U32 (ribose-2'-O)-methylase TrmJ